MTSQMGVLCKNICHCEGLGSCSDGDVPVERALCDSIEGRTGPREGDEVAPVVEGM